MSAEATLRAQLAEARTLAGWAIELLATTELAETVGMQAAREAVAGWVREKMAPTGEKGSL